MKLQEIKSVDKDFIVGDLRFTLTDHDASNSLATFEVADDGGLKVGEFTVEYLDMMNMDYTESPEYTDTMERLRKTGDSNAISRGIRRIITGHLANG